MFIQEGGEKKPPMPGYDPMGPLFPGNEDHPSDLEKYDKVRPKPTPENEGDAESLAIIVFTIAVIIWIGYMLRQRRVQYA